MMMASRLGSWRELFFLSIISTILVLFAFEADANSNHNSKCNEAVQRRITSLLENATLEESDISSGISSTSMAHNLHDQDDLETNRDDTNTRALCPSTTDKENDDTSCCTPNVRRRLMTQRTGADLTDWMLESVNAKLASALNQSLAQLRAVLQSRLAVSEQQLHHMFDDSFSQAARPVRSIIDKFFKSIYDELIGWRSSVDDSSDSLSSIDSKMLRLTTTFFADLFPPVYACIWSIRCHERDYALTRNYSECVSENFARISPFGDAPTRLARKLASAGRPILNGFRFLRDLSTLIDPRQKSMWRSIWQWPAAIDDRLDPCRLAMFQLNYCPLCNGLATANGVSPCENACQSAVQLCFEQQQQRRNGLLIKIDLSLNEAWRIFERRTREAQNRSLILEKELDGIGIDIREAINSGFADSASTISTKVVDFCGPIQNEAEDKAAANGRGIEKKRGGGSSKQRHRTSASDEKMQIRSTPNDLPIVSIMAAIARNLTSTFSGHFGRKHLAKIICSDRSVSSSESQECWNPSRHVQTTVGASSLPDSGLERAAAASAVVAGPDPPSAVVKPVVDGQQQTTDLEARLKRITDTLHRVRGPELEPKEDGGVHSERLVVADRPPSYQAGAGQSPYMMRNDELHSSGDGAAGDDDEGDDVNGELGSGDPGDVAPFDGGMEESPFQPRMGLGTGGVAAPMPTEGVYPEEIDEYTTKKAIVTTTTTTTKRPPGGRLSTAGIPKKTHVESEQRHPSPTSPPKSKPSSSASSNRTCFSFTSLWLRLLASVFFSLTICRTFFGRLAMAC